ncbi:MAG: hypothetical protein WD648_00070 [Planctomycetaceae bacterium]
MSASTEQRQKVFVSRAIQGRLIARLCLYWYAYHIVLWHVMFVFYYWRQTSGVTPGQPQVAFFALYGRFAIENSSLALCALAVAPLVFWDALQITHRVVGPLVRFQAILKQLTRGEKVNQVVLRDGDLLIELRDAFNDYLAASGQLANQGAAEDSMERAAEFSDEYALLSEFQDLDELSRALADDWEFSSRSPALNG